MFASDSACGGWVYGRVWYWVGYTGWVYRVGNTGSRVHPATLLEESDRYSEAGPVGPARAGVGGTGCSDVPAAGDGPCTTLRARSVPAGPPCTGTLQNAASWPIWARFNLFYCKVSQNGGVSLKYVEKACHSPYLPKRVPKVTS